MTRTILATLSLAFAAFALGIIVSVIWVLENSEPVPECARGVVPRHHNAWGTIFRDPRLVWSGRWAKSRRVEGHGNLQRVWVERMSRGEES